MFLIARNGRAGQAPLDAGAIAVIDHAAVMVIEFTVGKAKMTGEVVLDDDNFDQSGFRTGRNHQIWVVAWLQRGIRFSGGGIWVGSDTI